MSATPSGPTPDEAVQRVRRRLRVAPKGAAVVALLVLIGLAWGLWYLAHRQFLATWAIRNAGGTVQWDLGGGQWRTGGTSHVRFADVWHPRGPSNLDLNALTELAHLQTLEMYRCARITDSDLAAVLGRLTELRELTISNQPRYPGDDSGWSLTDAAFSGAASLKKLRKLEIVDVLLTDAGLAQLAGLSRLEELDLSGTQVSDASIALLESNFPRLKVVGLDRTRMTPEGIHRLMKSRPGLLIEHPAAMPADQAEPLDR